MSLYSPGNEDSVNELGLPLKIIDFLRNINKYTVDLIKELFQQLFSCFPLENKHLLLTNVNYSIIMLSFEWKIGKFENV